MADIKKITIGSTTYDIVDEGARQISASGMVIKGTASQESDITGLTNYVSGWCYKATAAFTITGLGTVENGDMIIATESGSSFSVSDWCILQNNVDTFEGATSSQSGTRGLVPAPTSADAGKFLKGDGTWGTVSTSDDDLINIIGSTVYTSSEEGIAGGYVYWGNLVTISDTYHTAHIDCSDSGDVTNHIMIM